jgi:hypothetical protein
MLSIAAVCFATSLVAPKLAVAKQTAAIESIKDVKRFTGFLLAA